MTDLTKLADALEAIAQKNSYPSPQPDAVTTMEAARILRAAAAVDVQGLIELAAKAIYDQWADQQGWVEWVPGGNSMNQDEARRIARAALESALRLALAAREDYVLQLLVAAGHVTQEKVDQARSIAAAAPKGTYPQEDRSREPPCHACGLGYKCRSANCPNTTPDPMTGPHRKEHHDQS